jgi:hypothetical protein
MLKFGWTNKALGVGTAPGLLQPGTLMLPSPPTPLLSAMPTEALCACYSLRLSATMKSVTMAAASAAGTNKLNGSYSPCQTVRSSKGLARTSKAAGPWIPILGPALLSSGWQASCMQGHLFRSPGPMAGPSGVLRIASALSPRPK